MSVMVDHRRGVSIFVVLLFFVWINCSYIFDNDYSDNNNNRLQNGYVEKKNNTYWQQSSSSSKWMSLLSSTSGNANDDEDDDDVLPPGYPVVRNPRDVSTASDNKNTKIATSISTSNPATESSTSNNNTSSSVKQGPPPGPFESIPPKAIPLVEYDDTYKNDYDDNTMLFYYNRMIQNRHECIRHIRQKHYDTLGQYVKPALEQATSSSDLLLVDPSYHPNVGDTMLTLGEVLFIQRMQSKFNLSQIPLSQCSYQQAHKYVLPCKESLALFFNSSHPNIQNNRNSGEKTTFQTTVALWHAGGNWGNLWKGIQKIRVKSFQELFMSGYDRIISLPQSLYYSSKLGKYDKSSDTATLATSVAVAFGLLPYNSSNLANKFASEIITKNESLLPIIKDHLIFSWRERNSYENAQKLYPYATNLLVPDIAFQLGPYNGTLQHYYTRQQQPLKKHPVESDVVFLLRDDYESIYANQRNRATIQKLIDESTAASDKNDAISFTIVDWNSRLDLFNSNDVFFTETAIQLLSLGKVVIADRLHASILSYLSGVPFIYLDNVSGKINQTLEIAFEQWDGCQNGDHGMYARATNLVDAISLAINFIDKYHL